MAGLIVEWACDVTEYLSDVISFGGFDDDMILVFIVFVILDNAHPPRSNGFFCIFVFFCFISIMSMIRAKTQTSSYLCSFICVVDIHTNFIFVCPSFILFATFSSKDKFS